ncbi:MAG: HAD family phosphatase [Lachnospiraceae bacterium]|nr:HAD family phosphatase [Lachnospiraceae bacterium]
MSHMSEIPEIKNFIFDVGRVLISFQADEMFLEHGLSIKDSERICKEMFFNPYWSLSDYGTLTMDEILDGYAIIYPEDDYVFRWFVENCRDQVIPRPRIWEKVHALKEAGYGLYLLSNYNEYFWKEQVEGLPFLKDMDGVLVSYREHMVKPEERFFRLLLDRYGLKAEECLYLDDLSYNTEAAGRIGINAITVESEEEILGLLDKYSR